jgi:hypothetical protein
MAVQAHRQEVAELATRHPLARSPGTGTAAESQAPAQPEQSTVAEAVVVLAQWDPLAVRDRLAALAEPVLPTLLQGRRLPTAVVEAVLETPLVVLAALVVVALAERGSWEQPELPTAVAEVVVHLAPLRTPTVQQAAPVLSSSARSSPVPLRV